MLQLTDIYRWRAVVATTAEGTLTINTGLGHTDRGHKDRRPEDTRTLGSCVALASFPGPAQLSVACSTIKRGHTASDGKLGGAWERGWCCTSYSCYSDLRYM